MEVTLVAHELELACSVGMRRHLEACRSGRPNLYGLKNATFHDGLAAHIDGACGEMAFAKARNLYWDGSVNTFQAGGDVGLVQVRTRRAMHYDLIVRDNARDEDWYVLVLGSLNLGPTFRVVGAIRAGDAKQPQWRRDHGGHGAAYFVPQAALRAFTTAR